jgi:5-methylcytosine-specific restriction endonuclease McrA
MPWMPEPSKRKQMHERRTIEPRYNTQRWRRYRDFFLKLNPICAECDEAATVVDHIEPVRFGGEFWAPENHQGLCAAHHNSKSGREAHRPVAYGKKDSR